MSSTSRIGSTTGVDIGLAGLAFQVFTLVAFILLSLDYAYRYRKDVKNGTVHGGGVDKAFKIFLGFLCLSTILIFVRCAYRSYELSGGYQGAAIRNQWLFVGLESWYVMLPEFGEQVCDTHTDAHLA